MLDTLQDIVLRQWHDLVIRPSGPMSFRFILQPIMAVAIAIRGGMRDARRGRPPLFWDVLTHPLHRGDRLREAIREIWRVLALGLVMDIIYQVTQFETFYPVEAAIVVLGCALLPYLLARGLVNRLARWRHDRHAHLDAHAQK
jgi:drug/metabolite transporter (DMT)-like permease